jgi:competence protein ComEA
MRRQSQDEVAEAARRRLELLARELAQSDLPRLEPWHDDPADELLDGSLDRPLPAAAPVVATGRHARRGRVASLLPDTFRGVTGLAVGPALLVVALLLAGLGATAWVLGRDGGGETLPPTSDVSPLVSSSVSPAAPSASASTGTGTGTVTVDVAGKVRRPGVTTLPSGSRVIDALDRAGGPRPGVRLTGLNLARVLVDGEQILVGPAASALAPGGIAASAAASAGPPSGALVNLNSATLDQLDSLPGVGPVTAQKILDWRTAHGSFSSVDELLEVDGIGEKTLADIAPRATL